MASADDILGCGVLWSLCSAVVTCARGLRLGTDCDGLSCPRTAKWSNSDEFCRGEANLSYALSFTRACFCALASCKTLQYASQRGARHTHKKRVPQRTCGSGNHRFKRTSSCAQKRAISHPYTRAIQHSVKTLHAIAVTQKMAETKKKAKTAPTFTKSDLKGEPTAWTAELNNG